MAKFGAKRGRAGHGGVDVQPEFVLAADAADFGHRIHRIRRGGAHSGADKKGNQSGMRGPARSAAPTPRDAWRNASSTSISRRFVPPDAGDLGAFLQRRVRLRRSVGHQLAVAAAAIAGEIRGPLPRRQQRAQRRARSRVLDHASAAIRWKETSAADRAYGPASRAHGFPVPCRPGWWPTAFPAPQDRKKANRRESPGRRRSKESRRRNSAIASA